MTIATKRDLEAMEQRILARWRESGQVAAQELAVQEFEQHGVPSVLGVVVMTHVLMAGEKEGLKWQ